MKNTVASYIIDKLKEVGVKRIWAVTGDALNAFADAVQRDGSIQWIAVRHEENAAFACYGSAQLTGDLAVCAGTVGPGALHLINGLYNAKKARVPVLAITGQVPMANLGTGYFQETDLTRIFEDICAFQGVIRSPQQAPRLVAKAIQVALWERAVVRLEIPHDLTTEKVEVSDFDHPVIISKSKLICPDEDIFKATEILNGRKKISILAGEGTRHARAEVLELSSHLQAPIVHTLKAADIFDESEVHVVGLTGLIGNHPGYRAVLDCEVLLMIGTDFPYSNFLPHDKEVIQIDIRPENLGNRTRITHGIVGDAADTITRILGTVQANSSSTFLEKLIQEHSMWRRQMEEESHPEHRDGPLLAGMFAAELNRQAAQDAIFALDTGESAVWGARYMVFGNQRRIIGSFNHGSMAVGLPACLGAQAAYPGRQVWGLVGDGAFGMSMHDLVTAVRYNLPIKMLVFNNQQLGFVKMEMEESGFAMADEALSLQNPDFVAYARACGADGMRVERAEDIPRAIQSAIASDKPYVIEAVVSAGSLTLPPHITLSEAFGFGKSKVKEAILALRGDKSQLQNIKDEVKAYFVK